MLKNPLTNLELLEELKKRIESGSIEVQTSSQVKTDPLTNLFFDISVQKSEPEETNSSPWLNRKTLLWMGLLALVVILVWKKNCTIETQTSFVDKAKYPSPPPQINIK